MVGGFFDPVELPASYIARFQATPNAEHFALGDRYDLLLGNGIITMVKLTTLVGCLHLADGSLRYDVRAQWKIGKKPGGAPTQVLGAWLAPIPTLHILAVEEPMPTIAVGPGDLPELLNVIDLGAGKVGLIVNLMYGESTQLELVEYRDGATVKDMSQFQSIAFGE